MKQIIQILAVSLLTLLNCVGQIVTQNDYNKVRANKEKSIFQNVDKGIFSGVTNGYLQLQNGKDTLVLDFQASRTTLNVVPDSECDVNTKTYSTQTTSGRTTLIYHIYNLGNILRFNLNGFNYSIGSTDGASDTPISGLIFNYCSENTTEFLTLYVSSPLKLTTEEEIMRQQKVNYPEAKRLAKSITILPGSTLILTIKK
jgi:hypothetical protein